MNEWSFAHFPMSPNGEWFRRLDRRGNPVEDLIAYR